MFKKIILTIMLLLSMLSATTVNTTKATYNSGEAVTANYNDMSGSQQDWIAIFPVGSTNKWENVIYWDWIKGKKQGSNVFAKLLPAGDYEVRVFFNNTYKEEASHAFKVKNNGVATTVTTTKDTYSSNEAITANYNGMSGSQRDWVAIFPVGSANKWENVIYWDWIKGKKQGSNVFAKLLPAGDYEVRVFFNDTYNVAASHAFKVKNVGVATTVTTSKEIYSSHEAITANYDGMSGSQRDWMAIYPAGTTNAWKNVVSFKWIRGEKKGSKEFARLPVGNYEVRVFFNDTFNVSASHAFKVKNIEATIVSPTNVIYTQDEAIRVNYTGMSGSQKDWIAIYPAGSTNERKNIIEKQWIKGTKKGSSTFAKLPVGNYEVRAFFNDTNKLEASQAFSVKNIVAQRVLYDDFEDGIINPRWTRIYGKDMILQNVGVQNREIPSTDRKVKIQGQHSLRTFNSDHLPKSSSYSFDFRHPAKEFKYLSVDMSVGVSSHRFAFGVIVQTKFGERMIQFDSSYNHCLASTGKFKYLTPYKTVLAGHKEAHTDNNYLHVHPGPSDYFIGTHPTHWGGKKYFVHYKINIEEKLRVLEPANELLEITSFITSGGDYDNLALLNK